MSHRCFRRAEVLHVVSVWRRDRAFRSVDVDKLMDDEFSVVLRLTDLAREIESRCCPPLSLSAICAEADPPICPSLPWWVRVPR